MLGLLNLRSRSFAHGVHPPSRKDAGALAIKRLPFAARLTLPVSQHIGAPAVPCVHEGQQIERGELIARPGAFVSSPLHAPATGTIESLGWVRTPQGQMVPGITIVCAPGAGQEHVPYGPAPDLSDRDALVDAIGRSGIVGLGGAGFPTHVKLKVPEGKPIDTVMINGAECEPYLTADHRVMLEWSRDVVDGAIWIQRATAASRVVIGVEANKPDAIRALRKAASGTPVEVTAVAVKYPQGAEKMLIRAILKRKVPAGGLPLDVGVVVSNVETSAMIARLVPKGLGLVERIVTVAGDALRHPGNYVVPLGTPIGYILEHAGITDDVDRVVLGGPMMGQSVADLDLPITKGTSGVLALRQPAAQQQRACIRCGYCLEACPLFLNPAELMRLARKDALDGMLKINLMDCFECGSCTYVCPSQIPLVHYFRRAKSDLRMRKQKADP